MKRPKDTIVQRVTRETWHELTYHIWQMTDQREKGDVKQAEYHQVKARALKRAWLFLRERAG